MFDGGIKVVDKVFCIEIIVFFLTWDLSDHEVWYKFMK